MGSLGNGGPLRGNKVGFEGSVWQLVGRANGGQRVVIGNRVVIGRRVVTVDGLCWAVLTT